MLRVMSGMDDGRHAPTGDALRAVDFTGKLICSGPSLRPPFVRPGFYRRRFSPKERIHALRVVEQDACRRCRQGLFLRNSRIEEWENGQLAM